MEPRPTITALSEPPPFQSLSGVDDTSDWPVNKLHQALAKYTKVPKGPAVILTTGGMNPSHLGHVQLLHQARFRLEETGYAVVGMWLSVSHDEYVQPKASALGTIGLSAGFRLEVARRSVMDEPLVAVGAWEARKSGHWPDFPIVTAALEDKLDELQEGGQIHLRPMVFYACGTDHAEKCGLYSGMGGDGRGVVVVPRLSEPVQKERPEKLVFVAEPCAGEVASISSTKVREAIAAKDYDYVVRSMSHNAAEFLLKPNADVHSKFANDFALLGVTMRSRQIFISLSSVFRMWDQAGSSLLSTIPEDALFFFGSKRSWVFPESESEMKESRQQNRKYTSPAYQEIRDLILKKEAKEQVFFLKPPGFIYNGDVFHGHPDAFPKASDWLRCHTDPTTGKKYSALRLDPHWWKSVFVPAEGKYDQTASRIIMNFQNGAHDYGPVMELLHQSNPSLEIIP